MSDVNYYKITGTVDPERLDSPSQILVAVGDTVYRAYPTGSGSDFCLYLKKDILTGSTSAEVYVLNERKCVQVLSTPLDLP